MASLRVRGVGMRVLGATALLVPVGSYLAWEVAHRAVYAYNTTIYQVDPADEWRYTACSRLVAHGYALFSQVFSAQPPLLFVSLAGGMRIFGESIDGARWVEIAFGLLTLISVALIAYRLAGWLGALAGSALLAISPGFLVYAHTVEAEGPMTALSALSLALLVSSRLSVVSSQRSAVSGQRSARLWRLDLVDGLTVVAGLALAAAILMKLFALETLLPAVALLVLARESTRVRMRRLVGFLLAVFVPVAAELALVAPQQQWQQAVELHNKVASLQLPGLVSPVHILGNYLSLDLGLTILAGAGLLVLIWRAATEIGAAGHSGPALPLSGVGESSRAAIFVGLWLLGSLVMLVLFRPLFPHHAAILSAPLAVAAACCVGMTAQAFQVAWNGKRGFKGVGAGSEPQETPEGTDAAFSPIEGDESSTRRRSGPYALPVLRSIAALGVLAIAAYAGLLPRLAHADRHFLLAAPPPASDPLVIYVGAHSGPKDFVAADDLRVADEANRLVPPPLCDPSNVRLHAGYLTSGDLIRATTAYHTRMVVLSFGIFRQVPRYVSWLRTHYVEKVGPDGAEIYVRQSP